MPPLGLAYLARVLLDKGLITEILDLPVLNWNFKKTIKYLEQNDAKIYGFSCNLFTLREAIFYIKIIKHLKPDVYTVIGGYSTIYPNDKLLEKIPQLDFIVRGEGEFAFGELCERINKKENFDGIPNLTYRNSEGNVIVNQNSLISDINSLNFPAIELLPMKKYRMHPPYGRARPFMVVSASRGCPFNCSFCSINTKYRQRKLDNVIAELKWLNKVHKIKEVYFADPTFAIDKKYIKQLCVSIRRERIDIKWTCTTRVELVSDELLKFMRAAGCYMISFGGESAHPSILKNVNKRTNPKDIERAIKLCRTNDINSLMYFMVGNQGESIETLNYTMRFLKKFVPDFVVFGPVTPFPGSPLFEQAVKEGKMNIQDIENAILSSSVNWPIYISSGLTATQIMSYVSKLQIAFYFNPNYIIKRILSIKDLKELFNNLKGFVLFFKDLTRTPKDIISV